mmetsp:Transcript_28402/g.34492  ORF Transcript_28402/g.34492 Transcript_28402/m.34492 type:complete len:213 (-) Transcript_28402:474-1112(-)
MPNRYVNTMLTAATAASMKNNVPENTSGAKEYMRLGICQRNEIRAPMRPIVKLDTSASAQSSRNLAIEPSLDSSTNQRPFQKVCRFANILPDSTDFQKSSRTPSTQNDDQTPTVALASLSCCCLCRSSPCQTLSASFTRALFSGTSVLYGCLCCQNQTCTSRSSICASISTASASPRPGTCSAECSLSLNSDTTSIGRGAGCAKRQRKMPRK